MAASAALDLTVHPLPILSIAEHHQRTRLNRPSDPRPVFGSLLGTQKGRTVELVTSFELAYTARPDEPMDVEPPSAAGAGSGGSSSDDAVDWAFCDERTASFKQVFPTLDVVGWYTVAGPGSGGVPGPRELALHRAMLEKNDAALLLVFDPSPPPPPSTSSGAPATTGEDRDLPVRIFQTAHDGAPAPAGPASSSSASAAGVRLAEVKGWTIESAEAERVAVSSVSQDQFGGGRGAGGGGESSLVPTLTTLRNALQMLASRTAVLHAYVAGVRAGELRPDAEVLRMIGGVVGGLPVEGGAPFRDEFDTEYADVQLTSYLATLSKSLLALNNLTDKFTFIHAPSAQSDDALLPSSLGLGGGAGGGFASAAGGGGKEGRRLGGFGSFGGGGGGRAGGWRG